MERAPQLRPKRGQGLGHAKGAANGRRIGTRPWQPGEPCVPLDLGRTLTSAITRQARSPGSKPGLNLTQEDLHLQVRSRQPRRLVVFVIDTSDSMGDGPTARISAALGASIALAANAYLNRDQVCLVTFRDRAAQVVVPPTDSVTRVRQQLQRLPIGGATPLAAGLQKARQVILQARLKSPAVEPLMVLISDGEATVSLNSGVDPTEEVLTMARQMRHEKIPALVIDTLARQHRLSLMPRLALALGGVYQHIHELRSGKVLQLIEASGPPTKS